VHQTTSKPFLISQLLESSAHPTILSCFVAPIQLKTQREAGMESNTETNSQGQLVRVVDSELIHVQAEQNIARIGLFSAGQQKDDDSPASRTFRLTVKRDGRRIETSVTFNGSLGLPTMACLDKWMAFMRIVAKIKKRNNGILTNPITFTGYRLLNEANLSDAGKNYNEIAAWGRRFANLTINSTEVIYLVNSRTYAEDTLSIFQRFRALNKKDANGEVGLYKVWLADWLLASLNAGYIYIEEYTPYLQLNRSIAKGLYNFLHYWFSQNDGRYFEKDYLAICDLLDIKSYSQISRIKQILGPSLDELVKIGYLSKWEIARRIMDDSVFKICFWPGEGILKNLYMIDADKRRRYQHTSLLNDSSGSIEAEIMDGRLNADELNALSLLHEFGINPPQAKDLVANNQPGLIVDMIEYVSALAAEPNNRIRSAQALLVSKFKEGAKIPSDFVTSRKRKAEEATMKLGAQKRGHESQLYMEYFQWSTKQAEEKLALIYTEQELQEKLSSIANEKVKEDKLWARMPRRGQIESARNLLLKELKEELILPTLEEWLNNHPQRGLFEDVFDAQGPSKLAPFE
jgi:hypothetical protein